MNTILCEQISLASLQVSNILYTGEQIYPKMSLQAYTSYTDRIGEDRIPKGVVWYARETVD
jgi:hypothetical protein